jgi:hypothetical protein
MTPDTSGLVAGLALVLGVVNSAWQFAVHIRKRGRERSEQARKIHFIVQGEVGTGSAVVNMHVTNHSDSPIYNVILCSDDTVSHGPDNGPALGPTEKSSWPARIFAEGKLPVSPSDLLKVNGELRFTDANRVRWLMTEDRRVRNLNRFWRAHLRDVTWRPRSEPTTVPDGNPHSRIA